MILNSEEEKNILKESLKATDDLNEMVHCLEIILKNRSPFAMYIATADKTNCMWIFDAETICEMVGGDRQYEKITQEVCGGEKDQGEILFFIFRKIGPIHVLRIDIEVIDAIIEELYEEL